MRFLHIFCFLFISNVFYESSAFSISTWLNNILDKFGMYSVNVDNGKQIGMYSENVDNVSKENFQYEIPCGKVYNNNFADRIVGGKEAESNLGFNLTHRQKRLQPTNLQDEYPWLVSIQVYVHKRLFHNCGGTIVHSQFILTAAHCVSGIDITILLIAAGKFNLYQNEDHDQYREVKNIFLNNYNESNFANDIALLQLNESLKLEPNYVVPGCIPDGTEHFNAIAVLAGWGKLKEKGSLPEKLQKVYLPLLNLDDCKKMYRKTAYATFVTDRHMCTLDKNNKDGCQGDSGGPLMCRNEDDNILCICGIVSWGVGCARPQFPGVYTKVSSYYGWIMETINENKY